MFTFFKTVISVKHMRKTVWHVVLGDVDSFFLDRPL